METKSLDVVSIEDAQQKVPDIVVVGNVDSFQLLCKASSKQQGWMKSAKALEIPGVGCLVQVTTQQGSAVAEALTFVPGVGINPDVNGGKKLVHLREVIPAGFERIETGGPCRNRTCYYWAEDGWHAYDKIVAQEPYCVVGRLREDTKSGDES